MAGASDTASVGERVGDGVVVSFVTRPSTAPLMPAATMPTPPLPTHTTPPTSATTPTMRRRRSRIGAPGPRSMLLWADRRVGDGATGRARTGRGRLPTGGRGRTCDGRRPGRRDSMSADRRTVPVQIASRERGRAGGPKRRTAAPAPRLRGHSGAVAGCTVRSARGRGAPFPPAVREGDVEAHDRKPERPAQGGRGSWSYGPIARVSPGTRPAPATSQPEPSTPPPR